MNWKTSEAGVVQLAKKGRLYGAGKSHMALRVLTNPSERYQWHYDGCGRQKPCEQCGHTAPLRTVSMEFATARGSTVAETVRICQSCDTEKGVS
jgi:hypothetical protein